MQAQADPFGMGMGMGMGMGGGLLPMMALGGGGTGKLIQFTQSFLLIYHQVLIFNKMFAIPTHLR